MRLAVGVGVTDQVEVTVAADVADVEAVGETVAVIVAVGVVDAAIVAVAEEVLVTVYVGNNGAVDEVADPVGV